MRQANREVAGGLRLAELLAALSLATDLADQAPPERALKHALLSVAFAQQIGVSGQQLSDVYYLALVSHLGCTSYAEEQGAVSAGDDRSFRRAFAEADYLNRPQMLRLAVTELADQSTARRGCTAGQVSGSSPSRTTSSRCPKISRTADVSDSTTT